MPHFFIILLKINLVLLLFAAAYYLILRRLTFYTINRIFLVFGILFSSIYPFINLTDFFHRQKQINQQVVVFVPELNQKVNALVPTNFITEYWQVISILFYIGLTLMALRLIVQFVSLYKMHRKSAPGAIKDVKVRILTEPVSPFSFWQTVYINPSLHQEKELHTILAHEQIHVKQWHSLDIILAELSVVFYWFNPGVWLMKKAVKENLEFITDQKILNKGIDRKAYQYSLLDVGNLTPAVAIVNNFNLSDLKKRIKMMNVKRSSRLTLSRYLLVTPVLLLSTLAFTISKKEIKQHLAPLHQVLVSANLIDETHSPKTENIKSQVKKQKLSRSQPSKKIDSASKLAVFVRAIFIGKDTTVHISARVNEAAGLPKDMVLKGAVAGVTHGEMFMYRRDSVGNEPTNKVIRLRSGSGFTNQQPEQGTVTVTGYPSKRISLDSALAAGTVIYIVNGKKLSPEEIKAVNTADIQKVIVQKHSTMGSIQIETKDKQ